MSTTLWLLALTRWPGRVLRYTAMLTVLPTRWAMVALPLQRQKRSTQRLQVFGDSTENRRHPLAG